MSTFYEAPNDYRNYICHYGVKGMRWKQRKRFSGRDPANQYKTNIPRKASNDEEDSRRVPYRRIPSNIANEINERIDQMNDVYGNNHNKKKVGKTKNVKTRSWNENDINRRDSELDKYMHKRRAAQDWYRAWADRNPSRRNNRRGR